MPVNSTHPEYDLHKNKWQRARDVLAGEDNIKDAGIRYLPKIVGHSNEEYAFYQLRARFVNFTGRTLEGLHGMIFRKDPTIALPAELKKIQDDIDLDGSSITEYAKDAVRQILSVGRGGTLVDWADDEQRPYFCFYKAEDIWNWACQRINSRTVVTLIVLKEFTTDPPPPGYMIAPVAQGDQIPDYNDPFESHATPQLRVLRLLAGDPTPQNAAPLKFTIELYRFLKKDGKGKGEWILTETIVPTRAGQPLQIIPFVFHGSIDNDCCVDRVPLEDIMSVNLHHYRIDADLNHGLYFCGNPTPVACGFPPKTDLKIGPSVAWVTDQAQAHAEYLEFSGQGMKPITDELDRDQNIMAVLGARLLEQQKREVEAADTVRIRQGGEASTLMNTVNSCSESIEQALQIAFWWMTRTDQKPSDLDGQVSFSLNTDFIATPIDAQLLTALMQLYQAGGIDLDSLVWNLKQGEVMQPDKTVEQVIAAIKANPPLLLGGMGGAGPAAGG
jgi:hypothetical protein